MKRDKDTVSAKHLAKHSDHEKKVTEVTLANLQ